MATTTPPAGTAPALQALWQDARGDWAKAHELAQADEGAAGSWVHAYLHRKEGDAANARYWYTRAGKTPPAKTMSLEAEREAITRVLLNS
ncbi:MAG: hypothetical protein ABI222_02450 [Opitutaceae bacterium]